MRMPAMILAMSCASVLSAQHPEYDTLVANYERAKKSSLDAAVAKFLPQFQAAAQQRWGEEEAAPFLTWIVRNGLIGAEAGQALDNLAAFHAASLDLAPVLDILPNLAPYLGEARCAAVLDTVLAASGPPELHARALLARATVVATRTIGVDENALQGAVRDLEQARRLTNDPSLTATIERAAVGPRGLKMGDVAPEVAGFDLDGVPFRLSDYRGKVVVLTLWGDWCGTCRAMYPHERSLVERLKDKPFALLGVNSDRDPAKLRPRLADEKINWRSFWNGAKGTGGGIASRFAVRGWPTIYILDAKGVIRFMNKRGEAMDAAVDELLAEMANTKAPK